MADAKWGPRPHVTVNGSPLEAGLEQRLRKVIVDTDVVGPGACRIVIDDPQRQTLDSGPFDFGTEFTVAATDGNTDKPVFEGVVVSLGFDLDERGAFTTVTGFDHSYPMFNGAHTKSYQNVSDSDIATQVARDAGLDASDVSSSPVVHEHVGQINETYWDFLNRRAAEIDYEVRIQGKKLIFREPAQAQQAPQPGDFGSTQTLQLTPGANLLRLSTRVTSVGQASNIEVRGWDIANKQALSSVVGPRTRGASMRDTPEKLAKTSGAADVLADPMPLGTQAEVDHRASAEAERVASASLYVEGVALGSPELVAGVAVSIGATGGRLDGRFTLTRARHDWSATEYRTYFLATGGHDRSLLGIVRTASAARGPVGGRGVSGVAIVTNSNDPSKQGRVKLKLPWLADDYETGWARVVYPGAGKSRGLYLIPEVNDEVLVTFEHGDVGSPVVLGGLYNGVDAPPFDAAVDSSSGAVVVRGLRTRKGHQIQLSDTDGAESIEIKTATEKVKILFDDANSALGIECSGDVTIKSGGKATIKCNDFDVEANGAATIKANSSLTLQASGNVVIKGATVQLN